MGEEHRLHFFERYLTLWVVLSILAGLLLGKIVPQIGRYISDMTYYQVSLPIAVLLFFMIYPIMVQIDFKNVLKAGKSPKPVALTLGVNWGVKPFTMAFFAWVFMRIIWSPFIELPLAKEYQAGMILLGIAPCTAMVLVWSYLSDGNMGHTLIMVAINSLTMLLLYGPLAGFLLDISAIPVPWQTIAFSVAVYVGLPLFAGYISRNYLLDRKGKVWFEEKFAKDLHYLSIIALLTTLVVLFNFQGKVILEQPFVIGMIAIPLLIQVFVIFGLTYAIAYKIKLKYEDAAPSAQIGASNHFEVAIAVATVLFGIDSGAALATVVGVLIEVPVMLILVKISLNTRRSFG